MITNKGVDGVPELLIFEGMSKKPSRFFPKLDTLKTDEAAISCDTQSLRALIPKVSSFSTISKASTPTSGILATWSRSSTTCRAKVIH